MCTLIFGLGVLGPGSFAAGANRDENPLRPSEPPGTLASQPHVVGGRDRIALGTWLAIRDARAVIAVLNRRDPDAERAAGPRTDRRSRGLLALEVARVAKGVAERFHEAARAEAERSLQEYRYAPFSLVCLAPEGAWLLSLDEGQPPGFTPLTPGWHVLTHADLDDRGEPRTARLLDALAGFAPGSAREVETRLLHLLALHASAPDAGDAVCLHHGPMVTVSTSLVTHTGGKTRYMHVEGRPCTEPLRDLTSLLYPVPIGRRQP